MRNYFFITLFLFYLNSKSQRIGNYISNGSFEEYYTCFPYLKVKYWTSPDSISLSPFFLNTCNGSVPMLGGGDIYQYPHSGKGYMGHLVYYPPSPPLNRVYAKNRMKSTLQAGKFYCIRFYINIENASTCGIDGIGAYFGGNEIDTITKCDIPLTYITPQVQNPQGNIITDTLNWVAITGTFTANGTEKYLLLGNFLSDANTSTVMINPTNLPLIFTEIAIDDVSCIPIDLEAYAGRDTTILLGDSVYIGRESDFAIDSGCVWYKLPDMANAIDTISGLWVKPAVTTTYVVRQELECSSLKWDTVVVRVGYVGVGELEIENYKLEIYPNPTSGVLNVELDLTPALSKGEGVERGFQIINVLGELIQHSTLTTKHSEIDVSGLENGIYFVVFRDEKKRSLVKKLLIAK